VALNSIRRDGKKKQSLACFAHPYIYFSSLKVGELVGDKVRFS
jgi:hypothetical protein